MSTAVLNEDAVMDILASRGYANVLIVIRDGQPATARVLITKDSFYDVKRGEAVYPYFRHECGLLFHNPVKHLPECPDMPTVVDDDDAMRWSFSEHELSTLEVLGF